MESNYKSTVFFLEEGITIRKTRGVKSVKNASRANLLLQSDQPKNGTWTTEGYLEKELNNSWKKI